MVQFDVEKVWGNKQLDRAILELLASGRLVNRSPKDLRTGQPNPIQCRSFTACISSLTSPPNCITIFDIETPKVTFTVMAYTPDEAADVKDRGIWWGRSYAALLFVLTASWNYW